MKCTAFLFLIFLPLQVIGQSWIKRTFPSTVYTIQYAGSTGMFTIGTSKATLRNKLEIGLFYGKTPKAYGDIRSLTFKVTYLPMEISFHKNIALHPLLAGFFLSKSFGYNVGGTWENKYPKGYYWWPKSLRGHVFVGSQVDIVFQKRHLDRIAFYWEANTNDLYLYSYFGNMGTLTPFDILFLGFGTKIYLK